MLMSSFTLGELSQAIFAEDNHTHATKNLSAKKINIDTRTLQQGDVFLALRGDNFDGHDYIQQAYDKGAIAAIVDDAYYNSRFSEQGSQTGSSFPLLVVMDTLKALGQASLWNRQKFTGPLVAITGSAGKTSVKSMTAHLLRLLGDCWSTPGNFNNHVGAPLTLLGLEPQHKAAVIELGASSEGEIAYTSQWAKPDVAIITNVSGAHLEEFGSIETIMRTKGEIIDSLGSDGCAVLNADDLYFADWVLRADNRKVMSFGIKNSADVMADNIVCNENGCRFNVLYKELSIPTEIPLLGMHSVLNALSAIAASLSLGLEINDILGQLKTLPIVDGRLQWVEGDGDIRILNDSYNASPASVKAAIDVLALWKDKAWLVLGDMAELGDDSAATHAEMGEYAQQKGIANFVATGTDSRHAVSAFKKIRDAHWFENQNELLQYINQNKQPGQVFLVKGSRSAAMDKVVLALSFKRTADSICGKDV